MWGGNCRVTLRAHRTVPPHLLLTTEYLIRGQLERVLNCFKNQAGDGGTKGEGGGHREGSQLSGRSLPLPRDVPLPVSVPEPAEKWDTFPKRGCDLSKKRKQKINHGLKLARRAPAGSAAGAPLGLCQLPGEPRVRCPVLAPSQGTNSPLQATTLRRRAAPLRHPQRGRAFLHHGVKGLICCLPLHPLFGRLTLSSLRDPIPFSLRLKGSYLSRQETTAHSPTGAGSCQSRSPSPRCR